MSKIYEALQNAQEHRKELPESTVLVGGEKPAVKLPMLVPQLSMEPEMMMLYHGIGSLLPGFDKMAIQFIASHPGEGTSTIVREFAHMSASRMGKSVLVLDADHGNPALGSYGVSVPDDTIGTPVDGEHSGQCVHETHHQNVFVSPVSGNIGSFMQRFESSHSDDFLEQLKVKYDLILIDSPPVSENPLGFAFCRRVDGVVLVVEAGKTRWPVVESLKNRVLGCGGRVLGIAFNKRKYDIPGFLYSRL